MSFDSFESLESDSHSNHIGSDSQPPIPIPNDPETENQIAPETDPDIVIHADDHAPIHSDAAVMATENQSLKEATPTNHDDRPSAAAAASHTESQEDGDEGNNRDRAVREEERERDRAVREEESERDRAVREEERERDRAVREEERERDRAVREEESERERKSALFDVEGDSENNDGSHDLYEPPSPLQLMPTGILHDIAEETEGDCEHEQSSSSGQGEGNLATPPVITPLQTTPTRATPTGAPSVDLELDTVEYAETGFFDAMETIPPEETKGSSPATVAPPPSLPVSPPPGPVLSPRLSMLGEETVGTTGSGIPTPQGSTADQLNRHSLASLAGDSPPPPLPSSLPPGKLISPRHSLMDPEPSVAHPDSILGGIGMRLDAALLSEKLSVSVSDRDIGADSHDSIPDPLVPNGDTQNASTHSETENNENEEPLLITTIDEVDDPSDLFDESNELLPPPLEDDDTPAGSQGRPKLKITPSFLRSLEPPLEFSDSGFPDTDYHSTTPEQG